MKTVKTSPTKNRHDATNSANSVTNSSERHVMAVGFDGGFGNAKLVTPTAEILCPAYVLPISIEEVYDIPQTRNGALVEYISGSALNLVAQSWMCGDLAVKRKPNGIYRVVGDINGKVDWGLQMFLGSLAATNPKTDIDIAVFASIQDAKAVGVRLKKALEGHHEIRVNNAQTIVVNVEVLGVLDEGTGVSYWHRQTNSIPLSSTIATIDFGNGTTIATVWNGAKKMDFRIVPGGVNALIEAIANNLAFRKHLGGSPAKHHLVRHGVERGDYKYGCNANAYNFREIYKTEGFRWLEQTLSEVFAFLSPYREEIEEAIAVGGGALLPGLSSVLHARDMKAIDDPIFANARGLQALASLRVRTGGEG